MGFLKRNDYPDSDILLSAYSSLVGEVFPGLLAVDVSWVLKKVELTFFVIAEPTDDDLDSISIVETEMYAHLPDIEIVSQVIVADPSGHKRGQVCVFAVRKWC